MRIGIGNDHTAVEMKKEIVRYLEAKGYKPAAIKVQQYDD